MQEGSVDFICIDPPYYNNVQYAELSDFFYVWQKRILKDIFPEISHRRLSNKIDEAVAEENLKQFKKKIKKTPVLPISAAFDEGIEKFKQAIRDAVEEASA